MNIIAAADHHNRHFLRVPVLPRRSHLDALRNSLSSGNRHRADEEFAVRPENIYEGQRGAGRARGISCEFALQVECEFRMIAGR